MGRRGKIRVHFLGKTGPGAGDVLAEGLYEVEVVPDGAVHVDVGDLIQ